MKSLKFVSFCMVLSIAVGCATNTKGIWKHSFTDELTSTTKDSDNAFIQTEWGEITLKPEQSNQVGLWLEITIKNTSKKALTFKSEYIKIKNSLLEIIDPMTPAQVQSRLSSQTAFTGAMLGNSYAITNAVDLKLSAELDEKLMKDSKIPPESIKKGFLVYSEEKTKGDFAILFDDELKVKEPIQFTIKNKAQ